MGTRLTPLTLANLPPDTRDTPGAAGAKHDISIQHTEGRDELGVLRGIDNWHAQTTGPIR